MAIAAATSRPQDVRVSRQTDGGLLLRVFNIESSSAWHTLCHPAHIAQWVTTPDWLTHL
jgi:hypothetical protein